MGMGNDFKNNNVGSYHSLNTFFFRCKISNRGWFANYSLKFMYYLAA